MAADVQRSVSDKPMVKRERAERESEGFIVPLTVTTITSLEGRDPALVTRSREGKCEGMAEWPNHPIVKARQPRTALFAVAKRRLDGRGASRTPWAGRRDEPARTALSSGQEACMLREKTIGQPCAGKPHARLERGPQVSCYQRGT